MGGYVQAHQALSATVGAAIPNPPPLVLWGLGALGAAAFGLEVWSENQANKRYKSENLEQKKAELYYQKAAEMQGKPVVNVHVHGVTDPAVQPSQYLMKESGKDTNTECFSCSSAHLASIKAGLDKMRENYQKENECGDRCQAWGATTLREGMALLSHDLTDERIQAMSADQQTVAKKYQAQVSELMDKLSGGNDQVLMLNKATGVIGESIRFANEGDSVDHPEVQDRLATAEPLLSGAERFDITAFDPEVAQKLRAARQGSGNAGDLKDIYKGATKVADQVTRPVIGRLRYDDIDKLAQDGNSIYQGYKRDRHQYETKVEKAEHIRQGLIKAAAEKAV